MLIESSIIMHSQGEFIMEVTLRVIVNVPMPNRSGDTPMLFGLQDKNNGLLIGTPCPKMGIEAVEYVFTLTAKQSDMEYANLTGAYVHGIARDRVLYLAYAPADYNREAPEWKRRVKISLMTIRWIMVEKAVREERALEASVGNLLGTRSNAVWTLTHED